MSNIRQVALWKGVRRSGERAWACVLAKGSPERGGKFNFCVCVSRIFNTKSGATWMWLQSSSLVLFSVKITKDTKKKKTNTHALNNINKKNKKIFDYAHVINSLRFGPDFPGLKHVLDGYAKQRPVGYVQKKKIIIILLVY